jgi:uncharacterized protein YggE
MRQVVTPQLLDDSRKLAQSLAAAAGVKLGAIRSISDSAGIVGGIGVPTAAARNGDFSAILGALPSIVSYPLPSSTQYTFSINVVFAVAP